MADNNNSVPPESGQTQKEQSSGGTDPGSDNSSEVLSQIPDALKGKSEQELVQMYQNLEHKLGEQSKEVKQARDKVKSAEETEKNVQILLEALQADENLYKQVQEGISKYLGGDISTNSSESSVGADSAVGRQPDDIRRYQQNQIVSDFYKKYGIDKLDDNDQKKEQAKIGNALANILDPSGKKSIRQVLNGIPLDQLSRYLESAYIVANTEKIKSNAEAKGVLNAQQNRSASIGSLSSSTRAGNNVTLTPEERMVAKKLGVNEKDYLKSKQKALSR